MAVLSELEGTLSERQMIDVGLIVSELVTNSVRHAGVDADGTIAIDVWMLGDRLRLSVTDPGGASLPRRTDPDPERPGGLGLYLVEQLSSAWGVARDGTGVTRVWCELALEARESTMA